MRRLLLLFVVVPAVELVLLMEIGRRIGTLSTIGWIVVTGLLGAYLAPLLLSTRHQPGSARASSWSDPPFPEASSSA